MNSLADILIHMMWPVNCPVCGKVGAVLCEGCIRSLFAGQVIEHKAGSLTVYSAAFYHTGITSIILPFKYSGFKALCRPSGRAMAEFFGKPKAEILIPVPLHIHSPRKYNQTLELAKGMSDVWGLEVLDAALWTKDIPARAGMNADERMKLDSDVFGLSCDVRGLSVVIVDDVCTTGMTLARLAGVLEGAGAEVRCAYTLAGVRD